MVKGLTFKIFHNRTYRVILLVMVSVLLIALLLRTIVYAIPKYAIPEIQALKLDYATVPITRTYIGMTQSIASVGVRARIKGFLTEMNFVEGKPVKENQRLFVIEPKPFQAQVDYAKGALERSLAIEAYQKVQFERMKLLVGKGDISKAQYDEVQSNYKSATADVQIQRASLEKAEIDLSYCYVLSPFNGIIGKRYVDVGNLVGADGDTLLATVLKLDPMYILFSPSASDFSLFLKYHSNQPFLVEATLPENSNLVFHGKVELINNEANMPTSTILMRATIDNPEDRLLPNLYVQTKINLGQNAEALLIPKSAILDTHGQKSVYIVNEQSKAQIVAIETGEEVNNLVVVTKGLTKGMIVLMNALQKIQPGMPVKPKFS